MNVSRRGAILGALATGLFVAQTNTAKAAVRRVVDYGSGTIGDWSTLGHGQSPSADFVAALNDPDGVYLVGDSIANGNKSAIKTMLANHGVAMGYNVWSGRPTTPAVDWVEAALNASGLPKQLLMITGSNDVFTPPPFKPQIDRLMGLAGPDRVVWWVTPSVNRAGYECDDQRNSAWMLRDLYVAADKYPNLHLIDWWQFLANNPLRIAQYTPDGVHPQSSTTGTAAFVALIEQAMF